ncbi:unnamed protein product [Chrysoparadoxa australica]
MTAYLDTHDLDDEGWFHCPQHREEAPLRLFCFMPLKEEDTWTAGLDPKFLEMYILRLPEDTQAEGPTLSLGPSELLNTLATQMIPLLDKPMMFFGHGFGALLCCSLAHCLEERGLAQPEHIMVTGVGTLPTAGNFNEAQDLKNSPVGAGKDVEMLEGLMHEIVARGPRLTCPLAVLTNHKGGSGSNSNSNGQEAPTPKGWDSITTGPVQAKSASVLETVNDIACSHVTVSRSKSVKLIESWNASKMRYPAESCLHDLFRESAAANRDSTAVVFGKVTMTFAELDELTDTLASWLVGVGAGAGQAVGIFMEHCDMYAVAFIAAHKAGAAYMPIEIIYPDDLLKRVLKEAKPVAVLTMRALASRLPDWQCSLALDRDGDWLEVAAAAPATKPARPAHPDDLAYVVMSSGTTGTPKGICCPHRGAVHSYYYRLQEFPYQPDDRVACNVFFVWEMLRPLLGGVPLYVIPDNEIYNPTSLARFLGDNLITRTLFTPSLLQLVLDMCTTEDLMYAFQSMRILWLCGEVVTVELRNRLLKLVPHIRLLNLYSISECHDVSYADLNTLDTRESPKYAPCGKVIPNVRAYVLDDQLEQVPIGAPGRMFVGGPCLALGYLNMPKKTAERFVPDPFNPGHTMYDTGDRVRYLPSGSIEVIGRCDFMVKIRGYSVVIGAVEAAIAEHPLVAAACVLTEGAEGSMNKRLVAYIVPAKWEVQPTVSSLQQFIKSKLPPYAIPSSWMLLDAVPLNKASGKLDRKQLARSDSAAALFLPGGAVEDEAAKKLETAMEKHVAKVWSDVLGVPVSKLSPSDDFYDLGGHSLLLVKAAKGLGEALNREVLVKDLIGTTSLGELALKLDRTAEADAAQLNLPNEAAMLDPSIFPAPTRKVGYARFRLHSAVRPPSRVFLTGATGFLGAHILSKLLEMTDVQVYCLVRAPDAEAGMKRIEDTLQQYGLHSGVCSSGLSSEGFDLMSESDVDVSFDGQWDLDRVVAIPGDLGQPLLGLQGAKFKQLAGEVDAIIHNGAQVNLVKPYSALHASNVLGTQEALRLAVTNGMGTRVKPLHYVSTNGVFHPGIMHQAEAADLSGEEVWSNLQGGYAQSKWVAEQMCMEAKGRGLPVGLLRPGTMGPSSETGIWNEADFIYLILKACLEVKAAPRDVNWVVDLTPVDYAAAAIVETAVLQPTKVLGRAFHLQNPHPLVPFTDLVGWVADASGVDLARLPLGEWRSLIASKADPSNTASALPQVEAGMDSFEEFLVDVIQMDCSELTGALKETGTYGPALASRACSDIMLTSLALTRLTPIRSLPSILPGTVSSRTRRLLTLLFSLQALSALR